MKRIVAATKQTSTMFEQIITAIREIYGDGAIPLHAPNLRGNEEQYLANCIRTTYVSYVGEYVSQLEKTVAEYTGARHAIATSSGTAALHMALLLSGVETNDEVITQALTFVATANAIAYCGARPVFVDSDRTTLGMSPECLAEFLGTNTIVDDEGVCRNKTTHARIIACVPVHIFGHPLRIDDVARICREHNIALVEDAAESLGSTFKGRHTGTFGTLGILSFNGNKIVTTGGGGMILTDNDNLASRAKHITTTAKRPHRWEFSHSEIGFNYRMPNINAAVGCAQVERLSQFVEAKREVATHYHNRLGKYGCVFVKEPPQTKSNYWLNALLMDDFETRDRFLEFSNEQQIQVRPIWQLMIDQPMFKNCEHTDLQHARWLQERIVNIPSSVPS